MRLYTESCMEIRADSFSQAVYLSFFERICLGQASLRSENARNDLEVEPWGLMAFKVLTSLTRRLIPWKMMIFYSLGQPGQWDGTP